MSSWAKVNETIKIRNCWVKISKLRKDCVKSRITIISLKGTKETLSPWNHMNKLTFTCDDQEKQEEISKA